MTIRWTKTALFHCFFLSLLSGLPMVSTALDEKVSKDRITQLHSQLQAYEKALNLTDRQKEELRPILQNSVTEKMDILHGYGFSIGGQSPALTLHQKAELAEQMYRVDLSTREAVRKILTPDQMTGFQQIQDTYREELPPSAP